MTDKSWDAIAGDVRHAIEGAWVNGVSPTSLALYSRWWQLETWFRTLVYVELKAAFGSSWVDELPDNAEIRQQKDEGFRYMPSPDAQDRLAYTDVGPLFDIAQKHWRLFSGVLPPRYVWSGRVEEFLAIRNRLGHCRRPHPDDLSRLEQTLRDLNGGAFVATSLFNAQSRAPKEWEDDVVNGWVHGLHDSAARLIAHADRQYEVTFELRCSRRPWAPYTDSKTTISKIPGYFWPGFWYFRGGRAFDLGRFWRMVRPLRDAIVFVCTDDPHTLIVSFPSMEDDAIVADALGSCFDAALMSSSGEDKTIDSEQWQLKYANLDPLVQVCTPWPLAADGMRGVSIFGA